MRVNLPAMWVNAPDDDIANDKECRRYDSGVSQHASHHQNVKTQRLTQHIGHMKFLADKTSYFGSKPLIGLHQHIKQGAW